MCLIIKSGQQPSIAQEDIVVWKVLNNNYSPILQYHIITKEGNVHTKYEKGRTYISVIGVSGREINRGLHSYQYKKDAAWKAGMRDRLCKFVIPTGATYYVGAQPDDYDGYVSDQIIFVKRTRRFLWWWI